jgi:hypothetical protein
VVLDYNQTHIRALVDPEGRIWMGDLISLGSLEHAGQLPLRHPVISAAAWINGSAPVQGYIRPQSILKDLSGKLPKELAKELPAGIEAVAWSVTPRQGKEGLHGLELAMTGSKEGILQVTTWLERLVAIATSLQGAASQPPEIIRENTRVVLRCQLTQEQLNTVFSRLAQPNLQLERPAPKP